MDFLSSLPTDPISIAGSTIIFIWLWLIVEIYLGNATALKLFKPVSIFGRTEVPKDQHSSLSKLLGYVINGGHVLAIFLFLYLEKNREASLALSSYHFFLFITHLDWATGFSEPSFLNSPYQQGAYKEGAWLYALLCDFLSFVGFFLLWKRIDIPLDPISKGLVFWNLGTHAAECLFLTGFAELFQTWVTSPSKKDVPATLAFLKWAETYADSVSHFIMSISLIGSLTQYEVFWFHFYEYGFGEIFNGSLGLWRSSCWTWIILVVI